MVFAMGHRALRVYHRHLFDLREIVEHLMGAYLEPASEELSPEECDEREREDAVEGVDPDLLVGPVELWTEMQKVELVHIPESVLDMVLAAVGTDDLFRAPIVVVGHEEVPPELRVGEVRECRWVRGKAKSWES